MVKHIKKKSASKGKVIISTTHGPVTLHDGKALVHDHVYDELIKSGFDFEVDKEAEEKHTKVEPEPDVAEKVASMIKEETKHKKSK